jgi:hypothetical protein
MKCVRQNSHFPSRFSKWRFPHVKPEHYCRSTTARALLPEHYCRSTTARALLPEHYCLNTTAGALLPEHYCRSTTAGSLLPEPTTFVVYGKHYLLYKEVADYLKPNSISWPVPVAARSKAWVCSRSTAETVGSSQCCMLSGRGLCDELITRPEESYRPWCVVVCDLET